MTETAAAPLPRRRAAAGFIVTTVAIDAMGIGLILPVMPELLKTIGGFDVSQAALWGGVLAFSYAAMNFLFGPLLGNLSDRYGRRPVLLASLAVLCVDYLVMAAAQSLWLLLVARIAAGIAGATYSTANAYLADISPPEKRAANFGLVGAGFGIGFVFGPAIGGLLGELGPRAPFLAAAALCAVNVVFGWLVLPESLPPERRRAFELRRSDPFSALRDVSRLPQLRWLAAALFVYALGHSVYPAVWSFYALAAFGWSPAQIGASLAAIGVAMALSQGLLIRVLLRKLGEVGTIAVGLGANLLAMAGLAIIGQGWVVYAGLPLFALGVVVGPALNGLMSGRTAADEQGRLQGVLGALQGVTAIAAPLLFTGVFRAFTDAEAPVFWPGAPFAVSALLVAATALTLAVGLRRGGDQSKR